MVKWLQADVETRRPESIYGDGESDDPDAQERTGGVAKAKSKGKVKAQGKRKGVPGARETPASSVAGSGGGGGRIGTSNSDSSSVSSLRTCTDCAKSKESGTDFYPDQGRCKVCANNRRAWQRYVQVNKAEKTVQDLEQTDPKGGKSLFGAFCKARAVAEKDRSRVKFNINSYVERWRMEQGTQSSNEGEMMWEGEYLEWAKGAKAGYLTKAMWGHVAAATTFWDSGHAGKFGL